MKKKFSNLIGALDLVEETISLARKIPLSYYSLYLLGAFPFFLAFIFFWDKMTTSNRASLYILPYSLLLSILFLGMKIGKSVFMQRVWFFISGSPPQKISYRDLLRVLKIQLKTQPFELLLFVILGSPILFVGGSTFQALGLSFTFWVSLSICVVFGAWVYIYFQNVTLLSLVLPQSESVHKLSWKYAMKGTLQSYKISFYFFWMAFIIYWEWILVIGLVPELLRMLLGIETAFGMAFSHLKSSTTYELVGFVLTYLVLDVILKILYTLRCFYIRSLSTGEDIKASLHFLKSKTTLLFLIGFIFFAPAGFAAGPSDQLADNLDKQISETMDSSRYEWRLPPELDQNKGKNFFQKFVDDFAEKWKEFFKSIFGSDEKRNQRNHGGGADGGDGASSTGFKVSTRFLILTLTLFVAGVLIYLLIQYKKKSSKKIEAQPSPGHLDNPVDLEDETILATKLTQDEWKLKAEDLYKKGELRLAMRALYLSLLSHEAQKNRLKIALFKSNLEYERELYRKAPHLPTLLSLFSVSREIFERIWYGSFKADPVVYSDFLSKYEKMIDEK